MLTRCLASWTQENEKEASSKEEKVSEEGERDFRVHNKPHSMRRAAVIF